MHVCTLWDTTHSHHSYIWLFALACHPLYVFHHSQQGIIATLYSTSLLVVFVYGVLAYIPYVFLPSIVVNCSHKLQTDSLLVGGDNITTARKYFYACSDKVC